MKNDGKLRMLRILELLQKESSADHPISTAQIERMLMERWDIDAYRTTIQDDITALIEAIKRIFSPELPEHGVLTFLVVIVSCVIKIFLGIYTVRAGKRLNSDSLSGSGKDALLDAAISATVLAAAIVFVLMYPAVSGVPVPYGYAKFIENVLAVFGKVY